MFYEDYEGYEEQDEEEEYEGMLSLSGSYNYGRKFLEELKKEQEEENEKKQRARIEYEKKHRSSNHTFDIKTFNSEVDRIMYMFGEMKAEKKEEVVETVKHVVSRMRARIDIARSVIGRTICAAVDCSVCLEDTVSNIIRCLCSNRLKRVLLEFSTFHNTS